MRKFLEPDSAVALDGDLIAGGSYSFDLWPDDVARWVSPGSWVFSSSRHHADLPEFEWDSVAQPDPRVFQANNSHPNVDVLAN